MAYIILRRKIILIAFTITFLFNSIENVLSASSSDQSNPENDSSIKSKECIPSETTASGSYAPSGPFCSGDLIFSEEFNDFDLNLWHHEITLDGGYVSSK